MKRFLFLALWVVGCSTTHTSLTLQLTVHHDAELWSGQAHLHCRGTIHEVTITPDVALRPFLIEVFSTGREVRIAFAGARSIVGPVTTIGTIRIKGVTHIDTVTAESINGIFAPGSFKVLSY